MCYSKCAKWYEDQALLELIEGSQSIRLKDSSQQLILGLNVNWSSVYINSMIDNIDVEEFFNEHQYVGNNTIKLKAEYDKMKRQSSGKQSSPRAKGR